MASMTLPVLKPNSRGADSVDVNQLPSGFPWYAGYVGGNWPSYSPIVRRFGGRAHVKSIAVNSGEFAEILDIENGDATVSEAPGWFARQLEHGTKKPGFYASLSTMDSLVATLRRAGVSRSEYVLWVAHYDDVAEVPPGYDAKQYNLHGPAGPSQNYDPDVCNPSFFEQSPAPVHHNSPSYDLFEKGPFPSQWGPINERAYVRSYDVLRKHPILNVLKLRKIKRVLKFLADRVAYVSKYDPATGKPRKRPDWKSSHRGYRFQQLIHRAQGQRFV